MKNEMCSKVVFFFAVLPFYCCLILTYFFKFFLAFFSSLFFLQFFSEAAINKEDKVQLIVVGYIEIQKRFSFALLEKIFFPALLTFIKYNNNSMQQKSVLSLQMVKFFCSNKLNRKKQKNFDCCKRSTCKITDRLHLNELKRSVNSGKLDK